MMLKGSKKLVVELSDDRGLLPGTRQDDHLEEEDDEEVQDEDGKDDEHTEMF